MVRVTHTLLALLILVAAAARAQAQSSAARVALSLKEKIESDVFVDIAGNVCQVLVGSDGSRISLDCLTPVCTFDVDFATDTAIANSVKAAGGSLETHMKTVLAGTGVDAAIAAHFVLTQRCSYTQPLLPFLVVAFKTADQDTLYLVAPDGTLYGRSKNAVVGVGSSYMNLGCYDSTLLSSGSEAVETVTVSNMVYPEMTAPSCFALCMYRRKKTSTKDDISVVALSATPWSRSCWCVASLMLLPTLVTPSRCSQQCSDGTTCGDGGGVISIYSLPEQFHQVPPGALYAGCYLEGLVLGVVELKPPRATVAHCIDFCVTTFPLTRYAGVQREVDHVFCVCDPLTIILSPFSCSHTCEGECGGPGAYTIYKVPPRRNTATDAPAPVPVTDSPSCLAGCYNVDTMPVLSHTTLHVDDEPAVCAKRCTAGEPWGIMMIDCYCLHKQALLAQDVNQSLCSYACVDGNPCGGRTFGRYASAYTCVPSPISLMTPTRAPNDTPAPMPQQLTVAPSTGAPAIPTAIPTLMPTTEPTSTLGPTPQPTPSPATLHPATSIPKTKRNMPEPVGLVETPAPAAVTQQPQPQPLPPILASMEVPRMLPQGSGAVSAASSAAALGSLFTASPLGAVTAGRLVLLTTLRCSVLAVKEGEQLDWELHPLRVGIGDHPQRYLVAAVVCNISLAVGLWLLLHRLARRMRGIAIVPTQFLLPGTSYAAASIVLRPGDASAATVAVGVVGLIFCVALPFTIFYRILQKRCFRAGVVPDPRARRRLYRLVLGSHMWVSIPPESKFVAAYRACFEIYRYSMQRFLLWEMWSVVLLACLAAWEPPGPGAQCITRNLVIVLLLLTMSVVLVLLRPMMSAVDNVAASMSAILTTTAVAQMTIAMVYQKGTRPAFDFDIPVLLLTIAAFLAAGKAVVDVVLFCAMGSEKRRRAAIQEQNAEERQDAVIAAEAELDLVRSNPDEAASGVGDCFKHGAGDDGYDDEDGVGFAITSPPVGDRLGPGHPSLLCASTPDSLVSSTSRSYIPPNILV
eukprot:Rhum_TRINITY_DN12881_c0_g1::Rhum_TRINITY_DN12881_c0_g1_i1::g.55010::m.55010